MSICIAICLLFRISVTTNYIINYNYYYYYSVFLLTFSFNLVIYKLNYLTSFRGCYCRDGGAVGHQQPEVVGTGRDTKWVLSGLACHP